MGKVTEYFQSIFWRPKKFWAITSYDHEALVSAQCVHFKLHGLGVM